MDGYVRPEGGVVRYLGEDGREVPYGSRWPDGPPEDAYGVTSHPERFALLEQVAGALVEHLVRRYDVEVADDPALAADLVHPPAGVRRAVRLRPRSPLAAPLTLVVTAFPGVVLRAGVLLEAPFPVCGCDACDESAQSVADDLEWHVGAVVDGRFHEDLSGWPRPVLTHTFRGEGREASSSGPLHDDLPRPLVRDARARLRRLPGGAWAPWPQR